MTPERDLTPDEEVRVRRLLGEARSIGSVPGDVAARLDGVLADLAAERRDEATVVPLVQRRRRGRVLVVAAAAVAVIAVGAKPALDFVGSDSGRDSAATVSEADASDGSEAFRTPQTPGGKLATPPSSKEGISPTDRGSAPTRIRLRRFADDALAARDLPAPQSVDSCVDNSWGAGESLDVSYRRKDAVLLFRAPKNGRQRVDLYLCGKKKPARSVLLSTP
jgi:hypothetical protein